MLFEVSIIVPVFILMCRRSTCIKILRIQIVTFNNVQYTNPVRVKAIQYEY